ncbi:MULTISPECIES: hypothetical protein [unclassified Rhizobium]
MKNLTSTPDEAKFGIFGYLRSEFLKWCAYAGLGFILVMVARVLDIGILRVGSEKTYVDVVLSLVDPRPAMAIAGAALVGTGASLMKPKVTTFRAFAIDARDASFCYLFLTTGAIIGFVRSPHALSVLFCTLISALTLLVGVYSLLSISKGDGVDVRFDKWHRVIAALALTAIGLILLISMFLIVPASEMKHGDHSPEAASKKSSIWELVNPMAAKPAAIMGSERTKVPLYS